MKTLYTLIAILCAAAATGQDYYWVGNSGNWSDLSHWATSSGGTEFHTELPGPENDVYFDANSFSAPGQVVTIDPAESFCRDFNAGTVTNSPVIQGVNYNDNLYVYGDLILSPDLGRDLKVVQMMNPNVSEIITGEVSLGSSTFLRVSGGGDVYLMDSLSTSNLYMIEGAFHSNNHPVNVPARVYGHLSAETAMYMGTSHVYTKLWLMGENIDLDMESATLHYGAPLNVFNEFTGGGHHYHHVIFEGEVDLSSNNSYDVFEVLPGAVLNLEAGSVHTADQFVLNGTDDANIQIASLEPGVQATFSQSAGQVNAAYLNLSDNNATGGAIFNAEESLDQGNNSGWNFSITVPQDYFWVGDSGEWTDPAHWATTSGGSTFHDSPPSAIDDVYFDANSFSGSDETVSMGGGMLNCKHLTIVDVPGGTSFEQISSGSINVYGDLTLDDAASYSLGEIRMQSTAGANIQTEGVPLGAQGVLVITGAGDFELGTELNARELRIEAGNFWSNGNSIFLIDKLDVVNGYTGTVDLSNSTIETSIFDQSSGTPTVNLSGTDIQVESIVYGDGLEFNVLTLVGNAGGLATSFGSYYAADLTINPGVSWRLGAGNVVTIDQISLDGTADNPITIFSFSEGMQAYISKSSGEVHGYHLDLTDNHAIGGATFVAHNSNLGDNVEGWSITTSMPEVGSVQPVFYPNPARDEVMLQAIPGTAWFCTDISGRLLMQGTAVDTIQRIDLSQLGAGVYQFTLRTPDSAPRTERIVVTR